MKKLRAFWSSLSPAEKVEFAARCSTSVGYMRKLCSVGVGRIGGDLVVAIERESGGAVRCEDLRPDIDWQYVRSTGLSERRPFSSVSRASAAP